MDKYFRTNEVETDKGTPVLHVSLRYSKGSDPSNRGYRLSVYPVTLKRYKTYTSECGFPMHGSTRLIHQVSRCSAKAEAEAERIATEKVDGSALYEDMISAVCIRLSAGKESPVTADTSKEFDTSTLPVNE